MEKREAPWGLRPGEERGALIDAWRAERGLSRNAALLLLIDLGLDRGGGPEKNSNGPRVPAGGRGPTSVVVPARRSGAAEAAVKAKNLPIKRASEMPDAPVREVDVSKLDVQVGPPRRGFGDLLKRGKK